MQTGKTKNSGAASIICYIMSIIWVIDYIVSGPVALEVDNNALIFALGHAIAGLLIDIRSLLIRSQALCTTDAKNDRTNSSTGKTLASSTTSIKEDISNRTHEDNTPKPADKATVKCPDCGAEYDAQLKACPTCACPNDHVK